jgi:AAA ATPase domain
MAQRMESAAPGGVMLSSSTARLVGGGATLYEPEHVLIKGADEPVTAYRLLGMGERHRAIGPAESNPVGRRWEMSALESLLDPTVDGHGGVVGVVGPPGIGKSRLAREIAAMGRRPDVEVFSVFCESHTSQVPFHAVALLLREVTGVEGLDAQEARDRVRYRVPDADPEDLALFVAAPPAWPPWSCRCRRCSPAGSGCRSGRLARRRSRCSRKPTRWAARVRPTAASPPSIEMCPWRGRPS